ncbi:MarR family transcriptional regulator [Kocuria sediminis]|uniref:MarR family transcriptional regulator n=1 Tax=Kocuria sediminis TaxID=1038857 RepID=A0A6N8GMZ5_9MICC|nr:MarR family transcriptional regulator [Kocuria sediminis]
MDADLRLDAQLCFALYAASRATTAAYREPLAELGLTYPQYLALLALWEEDGQTVTGLGARLRLDSGTLSPLLKRMETGGLLERRRGREDERRVTVHLTAAGDRLRERAPDVQRRVLEASGLTPEEMATLRRLARRIGAADPGTTAPRATGPGATAPVPTVPGPTPADPTPPLATQHTSERTTHYPTQHATHHPTEE